MALPLPHLKSHFRSRHAVS